MRKVKVIAKACGPRRDPHFWAHAAVLREYGLDGNKLTRTHEGVIARTNAHKLWDEAQEWTGNWKVQFSNPSA